MEPCETTLNDETEQLRPKKKSCCSCIPQRLGIIVLALIKLVVRFPSFLRSPCLQMLNLDLLVMLLETLSLENLLGYLIMFYNIVPWMAFFLDVVDILFSLMVIIGVCSNNRRIMKTYYMYSICVFGSLSFMCCLIVFFIAINIIPMLVFVFACSLVFMMQVFLNYLVKSEVLKMESTEQFQI